MKSIETQPLKTKATMLSSDNKPNKNKIAATLTRIQLEQKIKRAQRVSRGIVISIVSSLRRVCMCVGILSLRMDAHLSSAAAAAVYKRITIDCFHSLNRMKHGRIIMMHRCCSSIYIYEHMTVKVQNAFTRLAK